MGDLALLARCALVPPLVAVQLVGTAVEASLALSYCSWRAVRVVVTPGAR